MKILLIILAVLALLVTAVCLVRLKLRIIFCDSLKLELYAGPFCLNGYLDRIMTRKKTKKSSPKAEDVGENIPKKEKKPLFDSLEEILQILKEFTSRFFGHVRVRCARVVIVVGGDDPAKTAVHYGAVVQTVAYIVEILKRNTDFSLVRGALVHVSPDFVSQKSRADIDITLTVSIGGAVHALLAAAWTYIFK
ncbi:MAG: hypothetical protein IJ391_07575 [Clostridia bacterium]|nr:hypothetical protein [Clostridia bacterium]